MLGFLPELNNITDDFITLLKDNRNKNFEINTFDDFAKRFSLECEHLNILLYFLIMLTLFDPK